MRAVLMLLILIFPVPVQALRINEIMYNPLGSDSGKEFVEIFHDGWMNLSGFIISDGDANESLKQVKVNLSSRYSLIVENDTTLTLPNVTIYVTDNTIGSGGLNNEDTVSIFNITLLDSVKINNSIANNNGYSMEYFNGSFYESAVINGTPGRNNSVTRHKDNERLIFYMHLDPIIDIMNEYTSIFRFEILNKDNCSRQDTVHYSYNMTGPNYFIENTSIKTMGCSTYADTGRIYVTETGNYSLCINIINSSVEFNSTGTCSTVEAMDPNTVPCNVSLSIDIEKALYKEGESIGFYNVLSDGSFDYSIEYWVEDLFEEIVKTRTNTSNMNRKSFTPSIYESDSVFIIISRIASISCNNSNPDIRSQKYVPVKGTRYSESSMSIEKVYSEEAAFGDIIKVKASVYKGQDTKSSVKAYIEGQEKISYISYIDVDERFNNYTFTIPILILPDCDHRHQDGEYDVVLEGLDLLKRHPIQVSGRSRTLCSSNPEDPPLAHGSSGVEFLIEKPGMIIKGEEFETVISILNRDHINHNFTLYSYVYRGSISYSGEREENSVLVQVAGLSNYTVTLANTADDILPGDYKFKVRIFKDSQKTPTEFTYDVTADEILVAPPAPNSTSMTPQAEPQEITAGIDEITGGVVAFESSQKKSTKLAPYFLVFCVLSIVAYYLFKKR